jgi:hypothetical protein
MMIHFFSLDLKSLSLFRICLGCVVLIDLFTRTPEIRAHLSDDGVLTREMAHTHFWNPHWFCIHDVYGTVEYEYFLLALHALAASCLTLGVQSRAACLIAWALTASMRARNNAITFGGDVYLIMLLLIASFLPLDRHFCVVNRVNDDKTTTRVCSAASAALQLQICVMYVYSYFHKDGSEWRADSSAVWQALQHPYFVTTFGALLTRSLPHELFAVLTKLVLWWEGYGCLLLFMPVWRRLCRNIFVIVTCALHIGLGLTMHLSTFTPVCIVAVIALIAGSSSTTTVPSTKTDWAMQVPVLLMMYMVVFGNIEHVPVLSRLIAHRPPDVLQPVMGWLQLHQQWSMFAPHPPRFVAFHVRADFLSSLAYVPNRL